MTTDPSQYFKGRTVQEQMTEVIGYVDTRAAEVATDAIAADVAAVHQDKLDADAYATAAAASAAAAAGTLANAVKKTGESSQSIAGDIAISGDLTAGGDLSVTGTATVQTPVNDSDAATKKYVDDYHDATKVSITDINSYAVGLTGNQAAIAGSKTFTSPLTVPIVRTGRIVAGSGTRYWKIATLTNLSTLRYYGVNMIASRPGIMSLCSMTGQFNNAVYTAVLNATGSTTIGTQAYLGVGTDNGESCLIIKTTRQVTLNYRIESFTSGSNDGPDNLVTVTPVEITAPADYVDGGAIL